MVFYLFQILKGSSLSMASLTRRAIMITFVGIIIITFILTATPSPKLTWRKEYNQLIDIPFNFLYTPICKHNHNFLILVHTSPRNVYRRKLLRETWANPNKTDVEILFLTGIERNKTHRKKLINEIRKYKNFIHGDFLDTYENLTYKHVMGLKYIFYHCPNIDYVVKVDDDIFVNIDVMKRFFQMLKQRYSQKPTILCSTRVGHEVLRDGKWAVSKKDFPDSIYPPHCPGYAIIYSKRSIELIYPLAQKTKYFWIDDVHVTGTLAKNAGVGHLDIFGLSMNLDELAVIMDGKLSFEMRPLLFGPMDTDDEEDIKYIYQYMEIFGKKASILDFLYG